MAKCINFLFPETVLCFIFILSFYNAGLNMNKTTDLHFDLDVTKKLLPFFVSWVERLKSNYWWIYLNLRQIRHSNTQEYLTENL
jgi:hypothetical protein